ncbi:MAG: tyrosine-type recombinase/integrase [Solirubrobacteraceae bacterium]
MFSSSLKLSKTGWTLHRLRHSALTHLAEAGVNPPLLMAKSGHENLRSL